MRGGSATPANDGVSKVTMRVFAKGCPQGCLRDVLQILAERTPVVDPLLDATLEPGEWHHKAAWWGKDSQSSKNGDATVTLFRELSDGPVAETNVVEDGCGSRTSIRFVWDATSVELIGDIGHSGEQGFSVKVGGVTRDRETELYSYYVTVTEEKTKTLGLLQTGEDAFSEDFDATVTGLRGTPAAPVDDAGGAVGVNSPADQPAGTLADVSWELNRENCTLAHRARLKKAKRNVVASVTDSRDIFSHDEGMDTLAVDGPFAAAAPPPVNGVTETRAVKLRADRLHDGSVRRKTELPVSAAETTLSEDIFRRQTRTADKSQPVSAAAGLSPSAADGVAVTYQIGKTPGDLRDIVKNEVRDKPVAAAEVSRSTDIFHEQVQTTDKAQPVAAEAACVPTAAGGVIVSFQIGKTATGLRDIAKSEKKELLVEAASVTLAEDLYSKATRTTDRAVSVAAAAALRPSAEDGVSISYQIEKTPGDLRQATKSEETEFAVEAAETSAAVDAYREQASTTDKSMPAAAADLLAPSVEDGVIISYRKSKTKGKRRDVTQTWTKEVEVVGAEVTEVRAPSGTRVTTVSKSVAAALEFDEGEYGQISRAVTPGKRLDVSKTTVEPVIGYEISSTHGGDKFSTFTSDETIVGGKYYGATGLAGRSIRTVTFAEQEDGKSFRRTVRVETAAPEWVLQILHTKNYYSGKYGSTVNGIKQESWSWLFSNASDATIQQYATVSASGGSDFEAEAKLSFGLGMNKFGLWDGTLTATISYTPVSARVT